MGGNPRERRERGEKEREEREERFGNLKGGFRTREGRFDIVVATAAATKTIDMMLPKKQEKLGSILPCINPDDFLIGDEEFVFISANAPTATTQGSPSNSDVS